MHRKQAASKREKAEMKEFSTAGNWQTFVVTLRINIISR